jgi:hypothetical protein
MAYKSYDELVAGFWRWAEEDPEGKRMAREQMGYSRGGERGWYDVSFNRSFETTENYASAYK